MWQGASQRPTKCHQSSAKGPEWPLGSKCHGALPNLTFPSLAIKNMLKGFTKIHSKIHILREQRKLMLRCDGLCLCEITSKDNVRHVIIYFIVLEEWKKWMYRLCFRMLSIVDFYFAFSQPPLLHSLPHPPHSLPYSLPHLQTVPILIASQQGKPSSKPSVFECLHNEVVALGKLLSSHVSWASSVCSPKRGLGNQRLQEWNMKLFHLFS